VGTEGQQALGSKGQQGKGVEVEAEVVGEVGVGEAAGGARVTMKHIIINSSNISTMVVVEEGEEVEGGEVVEGEVGSTRVSGTWQQQACWTTEEWHSWSWSSPLQVSAVSPIQ
jgi:hypothetical protein